MSVFEHNHRARIYNPGQHPLKHKLSDFLYSNPALPSNLTTLQQGLDYLYAVLYPQTKTAVATKADLPLVGNALNDFRVVEDDGDGKAAAYRWEQREGDGAASWYKIYDMDWGADSILEAFELRTQDLYVMRQGYDDLDAAGAVVAGTYAGQRVFGGKAAGSNLTLSANSGDGAGPSTGYVQVTDPLRPAVGSLDLGTSANKFRTGYFSTSVLAGTLTLSSGLIADSSGALSFGALNLSTTGSLAVGAVTATSLVIGTTTLTAGNIADVGGAFSFNALNLSTSGSLTGGSLKTGTMTITGGSVADSSGAISFGGINLTTTGTLHAGATTVTSLIVGTTTLTTAALADSSGSFSFGTVNLSTSGTLAAGATTVTGNMGATTVTAGNLRLAVDTLSTTDANGDLILSPNGIGKVKTTATFFPGTDASFDLGKTTNRYVNVYLSGAIGDGTTTIASAVLQSLRDINVGVGVNFTIFWNGSKWVASAPDTEIDHTTLTNLVSGDSGHTQFALLAGRSGGQSLNGGTAASENLTLDSTAHATKGKIFAKSTIAANTDASYAAGWSGTDLGGSSNRFRHVYSAGEFIGLRLENLGADPGSSSQNPGRLWWNTVGGYVGVDTGTAVERLQVFRYSSDTVWDGATTVKNVTVSGIDATQAIWQLKDNTNNYEDMFVSITATTTTNVRITVNVALPAGSYRLIGLQ